MEVWMISFSFEVRGGYDLDVAEHVGR